MPSHRHPMTLNHRPMRGARFGVKANRPRRSLSCAHGVPTRAGAGKGAQAVPLRSVPHARTLACVAGAGRRARTAAYAWGARPGPSVLRRRVERPRLRRAPQTRPRSLRLGVSGLHISRPGCTDRRRRAGSDAVADASFRARPSGGRLGHRLGGRRLVHRVSTRDNPRSRRPVRFAMLRAAGGQSPLGGRGRRREPGTGVGHRRRTSSRRANAILNCPAVASCLSIGGAREELRAGLRDVRRLFQQVDRALDLGAY